MAAGIAIDKILKRFESAGRALHRGGGWVYAILFIAVSFVFSFGAAFGTPPADKYVMEAADFVQKHSSPDDLIIASNGGNSNLLYYSNRKGWHFRIRNPENRFLGYKKLTFKDQPMHPTQERLLQVIHDPVMTLEFYRSQGARYFVSSQLESFDSCPEAKRLWGHLAEKYERISPSQEQFVVYKLF